MGGKEREKEREREWDGRRWRVSERDATPTIFFPTSKNAENGDEIGKSVRSGFIFNDENQTNGFNG